MNIFDYYALFVTTSAGEIIEIENSLEAVADAICKYGLDGDIKISTPEYTVLNTFGIYVDRCFDPEYMEQLRPILVEKQNNIFG